LNWVPCTCCSSEQTNKLVKSVCADERVHNVSDGWRVQVPHGKCAKSTKTRTRGADATKRREEGGGGGGANPLTCVGQPACRVLLSFRVCACIVAEITFAPDWRRGPPITDPNTAHKTQREKPVIRRALALLAHAPIKAQQTRLLSEGQPRRSWVGTSAAHGEGGVAKLASDQQTKGTCRPFFNFLWVVIVGQLCPGWAQVTTHKGWLIWPRNHTCTHQSQHRSPALPQPKCVWGCERTTHSTRDVVSTKKKSKKRD
jgi:hypothetical protein